MVKQAKSAAVDPRDLWLAGLGVVSLSRKQALKTYGTLVEEGSQFRASAAQRIEGFKDQARAGLDQVKARVQPVLEQANGTFDAIRSQVQSRLAPVMEGFARGKAKSKASRKVTTRKVAAAGKTAKASVRKASTQARRTVKKAA